ncbi:hypothetical protein SDC9_06486 [bioreactor metagenome]|uniref:Uncharacterized protein n=1 Tax=bioreactor metagenome TaxID=1076179 RepID=A0A644T447_9ZZZZ
MEADPGNLRPGEIDPVQLFEGFGARDQRKIRRSENLEGLLLIDLHLLVDIEGRDLRWQAQRRLQEGTHRPRADDSVPACPLRALLRGDLGQFAPGRKRQPEAVIRLAHRRLELTVLVFLQDLVGEIGKLRARHREVTEAERLGQLEIAFVGERVRERLGIERAFVQHLQDEILVVDVAFQAEGAKRHGQQAAIRNEVFRGPDRADLLAEIGLVALDVRRCGEGRHLSPHRPVQQAPAGIATERQDGGVAHAPVAARSRSSLGSRLRSAFSAW